ncbi:MAG: pyrimidine operon attenuation protein/uracil phosphoribosyltransferase [Cocleimonas sp.]|jgi:pyrimidine operon attenuation protein/uracil phosphoribosyltransferase
MSKNINTDIDYDVDALLTQMSKKLSDIIKENQLDAPVMVGIHSAGVWVAERLHQSLNIDEPLGKLNINFYRDDFSRIGLHPQIEPSELPFSLENKHIILVDDVLFTGRTIRAAMNELFDFGRPASITLAVLIDRGNRELPVEANVVGFRREMDINSYFKLTNEDNKLELSIINK